MHPLLASAVSRSALTARAACTLTYEGSLRRPAIHRPRASQPQKNPGRQSNAEQGERNRRRQATQPLQSPGLVLLTTQCCPLEIEAIALAWLHQSWLHKCRACTPRSTEQSGVFRPLPLLCGHLSQGHGLPNLHAPSQGALLAPRRTRSRLPRRLRGRKRGSARHRLWIPRTPRALVVPPNRDGPSKAIRASRATREGRRPAVCGPQHSIGAIL